MTVAVGLAGGSSRGSEYIAWWALSGRVGQERALTGSQRRELCEDWLVMET